MSGTSIDGIDAGLVDFSANQIRLLAFHYLAFPNSLRQQIHQLSQPDQPILLSHFGEIDAQLGELFAQASLTLLEKAHVKSTEVTAIGSHGQTVFHAPEGPHGFSLQIGDPNRIAELTGITTICDFRRRDIAVGGQGAPLVPAFHQAVFSDPLIPKTIVNIGGIANISILGTDQVSGFDTGPGNTLMDYWSQINIGQNYDSHGDWASTGQVNQQLLEDLLDDAYFNQPPPKSTGKEYFSPVWLDQKLAAFRQCKAQDIQTTLCKFSADSIAQAILKHAPQSRQVLVCGGGAHNRQLMSMLTSNMAIPVLSTAAFGIDPDHVEAVAFAWLARQTFNHLPGNLCSVTGAKSPVILGGIYPGRRLEKPVQ
jgi:anhydro-N-acetylmuramic acid kinase